MAETISLSWGRIEFGPNEVTIVSTVDDPPGVRLASPTGSLGKVSFNRLRPDGQQEEMVLIQGKADERERDNPNSLSGEMTVHIRNGNIQNADDGMIKVMELRHDGVWILGMQTSVPQISGSVSDYIQSGNGRFRFYVQSDQNLVLYDTTTWTPIWNSGTAV